MAKTAAPLDSTIRKIFRVQSFVVTLFALGFGLLQSANAGISAVLGGLTGIVPAMAYAALIRQRRVLSARQTMQRHMFGELLKLILTYVSFLLVFALYDNVSFLPLFLTYIVSLLGYWLVLFA